MGDTVTRYASTPGQTITATFQAAPITSGPVPSVSFYNDAAYTTLVSGPTNLTQVSSLVWTAPCPNLPAQTLYISWDYKTQSGGALLQNRDDVLRLVAADVISSDGLCTLAEVKTQLKKTAAGDDALLTSYISAVTAPIEQLCGPVLARTIVEDHYQPGGPTLKVDEPPLLSVTSLTEYRGGASYPYTEIADASLGALYTFRVDPGLSGLITRIGPGGGLVEFQYPLKVVYVAGLASIPSGINIAARLIVQQLWATQRGRSLVPRDELVELPGFDMPVPPQAAWLLKAYMQDHQAAIY